MPNYNFWEQDVQNGFEAKWNFIRSETRQNIELQNVTPFVPNYNFWGRSTNLELNCNIFDLDNIYVKYS